MKPDRDRDRVLIEFFSKLAAYETGGRRIATGLKEELAGIVAPGSVGLDIFHDLDRCQHEPDGDPDPALAVRLTLELNYDEAKALLAHLRASSAAFGLK